MQWTMRSCTSPNTSNSHKVLLTSYLYSYKCSSLFAMVAYLLFEQNPTPFSGTLMDTELEKNQISVFIKRVIFLEITSFVHNLCRPVIYSEDYLKWHMSLKCPSPSIPRTLWLNFVYMYILCWFYIYVKLLS